MLRTRFGLSTVFALLLSTPLPAKAGEQTARASDNRSVSEQTANTSPIAGTDLARMLRRDLTLPVRKASNGMLQVDVSGGFRSVLVVQIGDDGKPIISCIVSEKQAERIFAGPRTPEVAKEP